MRIFRYFFMVAFVWCGLSAHSQELFLQGNELYTQSEYQKALEKYTAITDKAPLVWYNIGVCYYKLGQYHHARACWENAFDRASWSEQKALVHNMGQVDTLLGERSSPSLWESVRSRGTSVAFLVPLVGWQLVVLCLWFFLVFTWNWYPRNSFLRCFLAVMMCISVIFLLMRYETHTVRSAVSMSNECVIFAGPDTQYEILTTLSEPQSFLVLALEESWCKVQYKKLVGWVPREELIIE